jgi:hypothetical protein
MTRQVEMALGPFEQEVFRIIYGPIQENASLSIHYNMASNGLCNDIYVATHIKLTGLERTGCNCSTDA